MTPRFWFTLMEKISQSGKYFRSNQIGPKLEFLVIKKVLFYLKPKLIERCRVVLNFSHRSTRTRKLVSAEILRFEFWSRAQIWIYKFKIAWKKFWFLNIEENDFILINESTVQQKSLFELPFSEQKHLNELQFYLNNVHGCF